MEKTKLIDLAAFRKKYKLTQADLAEYLGKTPGFISMIERGAARLPIKHLETLLNNNKWGSYGLVPHYDRIRILQSSLEEKGYIDKKAQLGVLSPPLTENEVRSIKHGLTGISDETADRIIGIWPVVNKDWLLYGTGKMFVEPTEQTINILRNDIVWQYVDLAHRISRLEAAVSARRESNKGKPDTIFVVFIDELNDNEYCPHQMEAFCDHEEAKTHFDNLVHEIRQEHPEDDGWVVNDDIESYETYPEGEFCKSHYAIYLEEVNLH